MSQFDDYLTKVHDADDKPLLEEAIKDANAGALRSAYIMTWLSCAESIKRRFKVAAPRDGAANKVVGNYEQKEREAKSIDMFLLEKARDYGFVTGADYLRLKQIYEKRCLFGHPYETAPLESEVVDAMSVATTCLLSVPVRMRHGYLESQATEVVTKKAFIDDHQPAVLLYAREMIARAAPDLLGWWLAKIWKQAAPLVGDPSMPWLIRRVCWLSDEILNELDASVVNSAFTASLANEADLSSLCLARSSAFLHLSTLVSDQVVSLVLTQAETMPSRLLPLLEQEKQGRLTQRQIERLQAFIAAADVDVLLSANIPLAHLIERVIARLKSYNWNAQNPTAEALLNLDDSQFAILAPPLQEQLGRNLLQAGQKAHECSNFIAECGKGTKNIPSRMAYGMLAEMFFNDLGQLRPKLGCADGVLKIVGRLPEQTQNAVIDEVVAVLQRGQHKEVLCSRFEGVCSSLGFTLPQSQITASNQQRLTTSLMAAEAGAAAEFQRIYHPAARQ